MAAGASGADIKATCTEAGMFALRDDRELVTMSDFRGAWQKINATEEEQSSVSRTFA